MTTQVVFTVDPKIKARAMKRAKSVGIPFASVLKFATRAFAEGKLSMDIMETPRFNAKTARELRTALRDARAGKNIVSFDSAEEMDAYLRSVQT